jgi:hypothetical protein
MTNSAESKKKLRSRLRIALAAIAIVVLVLVVPPLVSVNRYKGQITSLMSRSLGRPVRLSSVEVRLLPWPGFVLTNLSVAEDAAYGAEPVLYANKVTASIRLFALWRGRLEIGKISVDEASLNLVRAAPGKWNLDSLFRTAAAQSGPTSSASTFVAPLPYLEATNSRIDFKSGIEKLPFSIVNADLSVWQQNPGEWRIRLRGQPARTDVSLYQEDTGVVRMEGTVRRTPDLNQMPVHLDLDWRQAQLGQLARLLTGSDPGWRGDLTGELHLDGTADAAQITTRLRAAGVHRAEFAPAAPLDFDANCGFTYRYSVRRLENLACDSPLGDGRIRLTGEKLSEDAPAHFSVELDRIPVAAGLDALRTLRSGLEPDLEAAGTISGKIVYGATAEDAKPANAAQATPGLRSKVPPVSRAGSPAPGLSRWGGRPGSPATGLSHSGSGPPAGNLLTGTLTVTDLALSGGGLRQPIQAPKMTLEPVAAPQGSPQALAGAVAIPAGGAVPLTFTVRFSLSGYQVAARGQASFARARQIAHAAGIPQAAALESLAGDPLAVDLTAEGPWIPAEETPLVNLSSAQAISPASPAGPHAATGTPAGDTLTGTVIVRDANLKADYLANPVTIAEGTLHLDNGSLRWDPVAFSYGPVKGSVSLTLTPSCPEQIPPQPCVAQFEMHFGDLDAAALETALLGAKAQGTLLSSLIDRIHPSSAPPWPQLEGTVTADSLVLGPVTLHAVSAAVRVLPTGAEIASLDAGLLGGRIHATGSLDKPANDRDKPAYTFEGQFQNLSTADVGALLGLRWAGGDFSGSGKIELSGYSANDLSASAKGDLHFEWRNGAMGNQPSAASKAGPVPAALGRFDHFTADASIANGAITLGQNQVVSGARKRSVDATVAFGDPPTITFPAPKETHTEKR